MEQSSLGVSKKRKAGVEMKKLLLALFFTIVIVSPVNAQSTLAQQKQCAEGAKKFFFEHIQDYGGSWGFFIDKEGYGRNNFTTHYNKKLDKCFIRIEYHYVPNDKNVKVIDSIDIWDVFEGKYYGGFIKSPIPSGEVENKTCRTLMEFENLIKPYMEE
jgi:hypothetical protein